MNKDHSDSTRHPKESKGLLVRDFNVQTGRGEGPWRVAENPQPISSDTKTEELPTPPPTEA